MTHLCRSFRSLRNVITDKKNGKVTNEHGQFAFALEKSNGAWHIASWVWATRQV